jgi:hypothetical protein
MISRSVFRSAQLETVKTIRIVASYCVAPTGDTMNIARVTLTYFTAHYSCDFLEASFFIDSSNKSSGDGTKRSFGG